MTTKSTCSTQQITMGFDLLCLRKGLLQEGNHDRLLFRTDTTTIKINTVDCIWIQLPKEFTTQDICNKNPILMKGVDALGVETLYGTRCRLQGPVSLRTTTVCYQYHAAKV